MDAAIFSPTGYDDNFLDLPLQLPTPSAGTITRELPYTHFTILLDPVRRLAIATGVNINGDQLIDVDRGDDWHLDPRIPNNEQTGEAVYAKNDLDRGHLVRRRDPVWGDAATAQQANADTFAYTNAAPQAGAFNQSKELWLGLEDHVLTYAHTNKNRISVFTAPVLFEEDPVYRGVRIPQLFWKVAAWTTTVDAATVLQAAGFVLDQRPQLADLDLDALRSQALIAGTPPPLGPYRTYQVPIMDIAGLTGLDLMTFADADVLAPILAVRNDTGDRGLWVELSDESGIHL
ncbi:DNA/RNA endonuclease (plasmid) [Cryobacterium sp. LW097]|uniref:DNA/RNA non-specific endonuclease n=1 Tax=unclassified Cryobacterium TaxID=2649013 RepID=UPI000B4D766E|nr:MULTISPECIES: DNA/RNA non-specific endonuclease [unclassified Cryobacterium]ASD24235.1 DNA/RNA endonuclease [Cryobacterium sp. LW097]TFC57869.1 DNA/RNA non-specific endonuclease [Cryobacterium sp. TMB3-1-2]TFC63258.1 DNA/RNA non-specific endonuclease [Cryobacterium sp. TMB1-7]TFC75365.1 DNA/RNA non-specific endonuclease [Cryobacterium sp. TMB3-15]TFC77863.1 DNA/RNA non-specific endonuclease [Cryobacterium sp. TMB3-10]